MRGVEAEAWEEVHLCGADMPESPAAIGSAAESEVTSTVSSAALEQEPLKSSDKVPTWTLGGGQAHRGALHA